MSGGTQRSGQSVQHKTVHVVHCQSKKSHLRVRDETRDPRELLKQGFPRSKMALACRDDNS